MSDEPSLTTSTSTVGSVARTSVMTRPIRPASLYAGIRTIIRWPSSGSAVGGTHGALAGEVDTVTQGEMATVTLGMA